MTARITVSPARLCTPTQSPSLTPRSSASCGWQLHAVFLVPSIVGGAARLRADVVLRQDAAGGEDQRVLCVDLLARRHVFGKQEAALAANEFLDMHDRRALRGAIVAGPLDASEAADLVEANAGEGGCEARDLFHDVGRVGVVHRVSQRVGELLGDLPIGEAAR